jgi:general secretion pathway protein H
MTHCSWVGKDFSCPAVLAYLHEGQNKTLLPPLRIQTGTQRGFTLLELLVVLLIISLMTAVVGFSVTGSTQRSLKGEGDKLAARLNAAHAQMNAGASPLRLVAIESGYAFETTSRANDGSANAQWVRLEGDEVLATRALPSGAALSLKEPLLIAREPITAPASFTLQQGAAVVRIGTDGVQGWAAK